MSAHLTKRDGSIDGLRGFLALYVMVYHVFGTPSGGLPFDCAWFQFAIDQGHFSVPLFFLVSGYLIYQSALAKALGPKWRTRFYLARAGRILPLWWVTITLFVLAYSLPFNVWLANVTFAFGFLSFDRTYLPLLAAWSLFVEECFYLLFPWIFPFIKKSYQVFLALAVFYLVAVLWFALAARFGVPEDNSFIGHHPIANFSLFFVGIALRCLFSTPSFEEFKLAAQKKLPLALLLDLLAVAGGMSLAGVFYIPREISFCLIFVAAVVPGTLLHRALDFRFLAWAGVRCYFIYIFHSLPNHLSARYVGYPLMRIGLSKDVALTVGDCSVIVIVLGLAGLSWKYFENPIMNRVKKKA